MPYMLLIMEPAGQREERSEDEGRRVYDQMLEFSANLETRGLLKGGQSLRSDAGGVRVQVRNGKSTLLDGPFSESKEMVGGFFLLDCESKSQAVAIARECPAAQWATVEVRELGPCFECHAGNNAVKHAPRDRSDIEHTSNDYRNVEHAAQD